MLKTAGRQEITTLPDQDVVAPESPLILNRELQEALAARRLVGELGFDEAQCDRIRSVVDRLLDHGHDAASLRRTYPALFVVYLVFTGIYRYEKGALWSEVHP